ncbi:MAG: hypothetical protein ABWZ77_00405 [Naasia sp.]
MSAIEREVDRLAEETPGVAAVYEVARPLGGLMRLTRSESNSVVRGLGSVAEVTVCIGLAPTADAVRIGEDLARSIRGLEGLAEARIHIRVARIHFEDAAVPV